MYIHIFYIDDTIIPTLLWEFNGDTEDEQLSETITSDDRYKLQYANIDGNDAFIRDGLLNCDGGNDFLYTRQNLHIPIKSHSLEVLLKLQLNGDATNCQAEPKGGGGIAIDGIYTNDATNAGYSHRQFDSIVWNEGGDCKWISGSEWWRRTRHPMTGAGVVVEDATSVQDFIHMVI